MLIEPLDVVILLASIAGGAVGARFARTAAWKGALIAGLATVVSVAIFLAVPLDNPLLESLTFLVLIALFGIPLKLGPRRLGNIVIGSFLLPLLAVAAVAVLVPAWIAPTS